MDSIEILYLTQGIKISVFAVRSLPTVSEIIQGITDKKYGWIWEIFFGIVECTCYYKSGTTFRKAFVITLITDRDEITYLQIQWNGKSALQILHTCFNMYIFLMNNRTFYPNYIKFGIMIWYSCITIKIVNVSEAKKLLNL